MIIIIDPQQRKAQLAVAVSELIHVLTDIEEVFRTNWKIPGSATHTVCRSFRLRWCKDPKGVFRLMNRKHQTINQMSVEGLITTVQTLPALWEALIGEQEDLIAKAQDAQVAATKFLHDRTRTTT